jgi:Putative peptidoglycan-binding domain-containing protein
MTALRLGSIGDGVKELERLLAAHGYKVREDALFEEDTERAVKAYQTRAGLVADGLAGPKTLACLRRRARDPKLLTQRDINQAAATLGVSIAAVMAVNEVESRGTGFFEDGRPVMLFERHIMYRRLKAAGYNADDLSVKYPRLVNKLPGGYRGGWPEYTRLKSAQSIDHDIALESASWGQYQIMGFHWQPLGYKSVQAFVEAIQTSEAEHLAAFVRFIQADSALHKALKSKKWAEFARIYNGPAYKKNMYDIKLARAFERYSALDDLAEQGA